MDRSLLCKAVQEGNCEKVRELAQSNPQILNTVSPLGNTALHLAASRKNYKVAELLLSLKPCIILMRNVKQETALHKAAAEGCLEVVELLLNFTNELRCNSPECAHPEGFDLEGCRLDPMDHWRAENVDHETALHYAARGDYVEIVSVLLEKVKGIELILNKAGESALYTACERGSSRSIRILGERDCISDTRLDKQTCLHQLITMDGPSTTDMALYLLEKRPALAEKADAADNVPLHFASRRDNLRILEELLKIRPDMALQKNNDDMAAIHVAALMGYEDIVSCLIDNVPDCIEVLGKDNKNTLHLALEYGNISVAETLLSKSMDPSFLINHADKDGQTAFHKAAMGAKLEVLSTMLEISRWNVNAEDNKGLTPLNIVVDKNICYSQLIVCGAHRKEGRNLKWESFKPFLRRSPKIDSEAEDKSEGGDNLSVIAALIFTVTFAAAFTIPGGVRSDNGVPVRMHSIALQCFIICDTLAFYFSILAMFSLTIKSKNKREASIRMRGFVLFKAKYDRGFLSFNIGNRYVIWHNQAHLVYNAINATVLSFMTGVYVMVAPKFLCLAVTVCATGTFTYFIYFFMLWTMPAIRPGI